MRWTRAYRNRLDDNAFLYIAPGGRIDATGRTKPRGLRHLPVRNHLGRVDVRHVRNALSRIPRTHIPAKAEAKKAAKAMLAKSHVLKSIDEETLRALSRGAKARKRAA